MTSMFRGNIKTQLDCVPKYKKRIDNNSLIITICINKSTKNYKIRIILTSIDLQAINRSLN